MKNFIQEGDTVTLTAPYAVTSGQGFQVGTLFAVASADAANGASVEGVIDGVFDITKNTGANESFAQGAAVYWDNTNKRCTYTSNTNANKLIGAATVAATTSATVVRVRLNGIAS